VNERVYFAPIQTQYTENPIKQKNFSTAIWWQFQYRILRLNTRMPVLLIRQQLNI